MSDGLVVRARAQGAEAAKRLQPEHETARGRGLQRHGRAGGGRSSPEARTPSPRQTSGARRAEAAGRSRPGVGYVTGRLRPRPEHADVEAAPRAGRAVDGGEGERG